MYRLAWYTDAALTSFAGDSGATYKPTEGITLYAKWKKVIVLGDASGDGVVDVRDVAVLRRYLAGWHVTVDIAAADVNRDGEVNLKDVTVLRRYLAGGWGIVLE